MVDISYAPQVEPEALPGRANPRFVEQADSAQFGGAVGQGLENAGAAINQAHDQQRNQALAVQDRMQQQAEQSMLTDAHNKLQIAQFNLTHNPQTGAFAQQGKNAFDLQNKYLPQFDDQAQQILDGIASPRVKEAATLAAAGMRGQMAEQLDSHEIDQHQKFAVSTADDSVNLALRTAWANHNHPDIIATNRDTAMASLETKGQALGWNDDQLNEAKADTLAKFHTGMIDSLLGEDKFQMADAYLKANAQDMMPTAIWEARRTIDAHVKEQQNEQRQVIADKYGDSLAAARAGMGQSGITVSKQELQLLYPKDWQHHWNGLLITSQAAQEAKTYDQMPPDQIEADLQKAQPVAGAPDAAANIGAYDIKREAAEKSWKERNADPARFVVSKGLGWQPLNLQQPQAALAQLTSRANSQPLMSEQLGVGVPLLSRDEAKQVSSWLDQQSPAARVQTLQQLRSALPAEQDYNSILQTVAPGSALTALAGTLIDRPPAAERPSWYQEGFAPGPMVSQRILEGQDILRAKDEKGVSSKFPMPEQKDLLWQFQAAMTKSGGDADLFRDRPDAFQNYYSAYQAMYAAEASKAGVISKTVNQDIANRAAEAVLGSTTQYGHTTVAVPRGMDPTMFEAIVDSATEQAMKGVGYSDEDVKALRAYGIRELGNTLGTGRYIIINGNGDPLKGRQGTPVIVDVNKQYRGAGQPALPQERPSIWRSLLSATGPSVVGDGTVVE